MIDNDRGGEVAIIGMTLRVPGARGPKEFWRNLREGAESISFFSEEELASSGVDPKVSADDRYVPARGVLEDAERFDTTLFGMTDLEATVMDPQHRVFAECAFEALESAGYAPSGDGPKVGVYAGSFKTDYLHRVSSDPHLFRTVGPLQIRIFNDKDFLTTWVSFKLGLRGPSLSVQTACSTSLVAVHLACQGLLGGECDLALAGGVAITIPQKMGYVSYEGGVESPDGHCRAFDARAGGMVSGNGAGVVVLKRLEAALADRDVIRAVIKGTAVNNDGAAKMAFSAPSVEGQAEVIAEAMAVAQAAPETISYVEAHGTGTPLGDPIEWAALTKAFGLAPARNESCAIGSVKTNIGHLDAAAGVVGLVKTVLALEHREIPPSLHFEVPNPEIDFEAGPFRVNDALGEWRGPSPRRAGVSSMGVGGTNAHAVLEEAPPTPHSGPSRPAKLLLLSAATATAVERMAVALDEHLKRHPEIDLADVAYTLKVGRTPLAHRRMCVARDREDIGTWIEGASPIDSARLGGKPEAPDVVFMFPGQGAQYLGMGRELYQVEPDFREEIDACCAVLAPLVGSDLREVLFSADSGYQHEDESLTATALAQPALFTVEYALARLWMSWGVRPRAMIGHSVGEFVAACLAGVLTRDRALELVAARGRLMQRLPSGAMLAIGCTETAARALLGDDLDLAAVNGHSFCVVSGPTPAVERLEADLLARDVPNRRLKTSHAFHSAMMDPMLPEFRRELERSELRPPTIPYVSGLTGEWVTPNDAMGPEYWVGQTRRTVRFAQGFERLLDLSNVALLEVGPGHTLTTMVTRDQRSSSPRAPIASMRHPEDRRSDVEILLGAAGQLWLSGVEPDWDRFFRHEARRRILLPTYPFERRRYLVGTPGEPVSTGEPRPSAILESHSEDALPPSADGVEVTISGIWREIFGHDRIQRHDNFFDLGGNSLLAIQIAARMRDELQMEMPINAILESPTIARLAEAIEKQRPREEDLEALERLLSEVESLGEAPDLDEASDG